MKNKIKFQLRNKYMFEAAGLLIVVVMLFVMGMTPRTIDSMALSISAEEYSNEFTSAAYLPGETIPEQYEILNKGSARMVNGFYLEDLPHLVTPEPSENIFQQVSLDIILDDVQLYEVEEVVYEIIVYEPIEEVAEVLVYRHNSGSSIISLYGYDNVWISPDGTHAYRFHTGTWHDATRGRTDGMTVQPWALDILYEVWLEHSDYLVSFDMLLGLIMKESNGRYWIQVVDTNGQLSTGMLQFNNWQGRMDGNAMAIVRTNNVPQTLLGDQAINARDNNPNTVWFTYYWDGTDVRMMIERWSWFNSILHQNGWSQQRTIMAHRFGAFSSALDNISLQNTEWAAVERRMNNLVLPYRLI